ncbi:MAG TPA: hypothetical protein DEB39_00510 [Planctomycetaceae bacterium]|nr:hypothetical protein [Planctomycetaceae bacterium]
MSNPSYPDAPPYPSSGQQCPKNWLVESIVATILCCLPFGIVAIIFAAQVSGKFQAGDYAGAQKASDTAKMWTIVSFACGLVVTILYVGMMVLGVIGGAVAEM